MVVRGWRPLSCLVACRGQAQVDCAMGLACTGAVANAGTGAHGMPPLDIAVGDRSRHDDLDLGEELDLLDVDIFE